MRYSETSLLSHVSYNPSRRYSQGVSRMLQRKRNTSLLSSKEFSSFKLRTSMKMELLRILSNSFLDISNPIMQKYTPQME